MIQERIINLYTIISACHTKERLDLVGKKASGIELKLKGRDREKSYHSF